MKWLHCDKTFDQDKGESNANGDEFDKQTVAVILKNRVENDRFMNF